MALEAELIDIFLGYFDARLILVRIQDCLDFQSGACLGASNEIYHGFIVLLGHKVS